ncbi:hypothetical protein CEXT_486701, partial [Caerostris extrusa]
SIPESTSQRFLGEHEKSGQSAQPMCPMTKCRITWLLEQFSVCQELKYSKLSRRNRLEDSILFPVQVKNLLE